MCVIFEQILKLCYKTKFKRGPPEAGDSSPSCCGNFSVSFVTHVIQSLRCRREGSHQPQLGFEAPCITYHGAQIPDLLAETSDIYEAMPLYAKTAMRYVFSLSQQMLQLITACRIISLFRRFGRNVTTNFSHRCKISKDWHFIMKQFGTRRGKCIKTGQYLQTNEKKTEQKR